MQNSRIFGMLLRGRGPQRALCEGGSIRVIGLYYSV